MLLSTAIAIWLSGRFQTFAANRGMLQFLVVIPLACLLTAAGLALRGVLTRAQMLWAMAPVEALILFGVGTFEPGWRSWPWAFMISAVLFVPWTSGVLMGSAARRRDPVSR